MEYSIKTCVRKGARRRRKKNREGKIFDFTLEYTQSFLSGHRNLPSSLYGHTHTQRCRHTSGKRERTKAYLVDDVLSVVDAHATVLVFDLVCLEIHSENAWRRHCVDTGDAVEEPKGAKSQ